VLVIEHNLDVMKSSDWIIDMGPDGGMKGGKIVGEGTPKDVAKLKSYTGQYLKNAFKKRGRLRRRNRIYGLHKTFKKTSSIELVFLLYTFHFQQFFIP